MTNIEYVVILDGHIHPATTREGAAEFAAFRVSIGDDARVVRRVVIVSDWRPVGGEGDVS